MAFQLFCQVVADFVMENELLHERTKEIGIVPCKDYDQPGHQPSLIRT